MLPKKLAAIVELFESFSEAEKRETLVAYAESFKQLEPTKGEQFDLEDTRKDEECADSVGLYLKVDTNQRVYFKVTLGPHVQTLTRAMASILCEGLKGSELDTVLELPQDFIKKIVGGELYRLRSQTVYYVLTRMKGICKAYKSRHLKCLDSA